MRNSKNFYFFREDNADEDILDEDFDDNADDDTVLYEDDNENIPIFNFLREQEGKW